MKLAEFAALFDRFQRSAFRVEARDWYDVEDEREEFAAFLEGQDSPRRTPANDSWLALVAAARRDGRTVARVPIVAEPLTDYTRFEFAGYPDNIAAGERVEVITRSILSGTDQSWASEDFWIFDDEMVVLLDYDEHGRFLGVEQTHDVGKYLQAKRRALSLAVGFDHYLGQHES